MKNHFSGHANKGGVYKIINTTNGRIYIGSCKRFKQRAYEHFSRLKGKRHANSFLQNDFNKCGKDVFEFHVFEVVDGAKDKRTLREEVYILKYYDEQKQCYNIKKDPKSLPRRVQSNDPDVTSKLLSEKGKAAWADPKIRASRMKTMKSKEFRKKQSENQKRVSQNPNNGNSAEAHRRRHSDKKYQEKHLQILKEAWANDDGSRRKKASEVGKKVYATNKKKLEKAKVKAKSKCHGKAISPDGKIYEVYNLDGFCREHGIKSAGNFYNLMHGRAKSCYGWRKAQSTS